VSLVRRQAVQGCVDGITETSTGGRGVVHLTEQPFQLADPPFQTILFTTQDPFVGWEVPAAASSANQLPQKSMQSELHQLVPRNPTSISKIWLNVWKCCISCQKVLRCSLDARIGDIGERFDTSRDQAHGLQR